MLRFHLFRYVQESEKPAFNQALADLRSRQPGLWFTTTKARSGFHEILLLTEAGKGECAAVVELLAQHHPHWKHVVAQLNFMTPDHKINALAVWGYLDDVGGYDADMLGLLKNAYSDAMIDAAADHEADVDGADESVVASHIMRHVDRHGYVGAIADTYATLYADSYETARDDHENGLIGSFNMSHPAHNRNDEVVTIITSRA